MKKIAMMTMLPMALVLGACESTPTEPARTTVVEAAQKVNTDTGEFSTLLAAVVAAGLVEALSADGQRTVFAPTDAAFAKLGLNASNIGTVPNATLTGILLYHVAPVRLPAASVLALSQIQMANGSMTSIRLEGGNAFINNSRILATDVEATNGIIHVIDTVLIP